MNHNIWTQHSYTQKVYSQTMCKPDYSQVTESRIHSWITVSGHSTVILTGFIIRRCVNQTTAKLVNHQYIAGSHIWITVSAHSTVIITGFIIRRCVNQTTARSLNPESKSSSQFWTQHSYTQKVYNRTVCKPAYSQVTESRIHSWITHLDHSIWTQQSQKVYNQTMCKADYSQVTQSQTKIYFTEGL